MDKSPKKKSSKKSIHPLKSFYQKLPPKIKAKALPLGLGLLAVLVLAVMMPGKPNPSGQLSQTELVLLEDFALVAGQNQAIDQDEDMSLSPSESLGTYRPQSFNPAENLTGLLPEKDMGDSYIPKDPVLSGSVSDLHFIKRCNADDYDREKAWALETAKKDESRRTIPIRYAISTGHVLDEQANMAYNRSILRKDDTGYSFILIAPKDKEFLRTSDGAKHYVVDHRAAKRDYLDSQKCYFNVVKIDRLEYKEILYHDKNQGGNSLYYSNTWALMHHGPRYAPEEDSSHAPRLFETVDKLPSPQIVPLYVADIRPSYFPFLSENILNGDFSTSAVRGKEYQVLVRNLFNLRTVFKNRRLIVETLSRPQTLGRYKIDGYVGMEQFMDNILFGGKAYAMEQKNNVLVLDLGKAKIKTSSVHWGSFFNLAGLSLKGEDTPKHRLALGHMTGWIGGYLENVNTSALPFWQRAAEDGFLVSPMADGKVHSVGEIVGNSMEIEGKSFKSTFEALEKLAGKDCSSTQLKKRYLGPWDGEYYTTKLKVWVDKNRNGITDDGEIQSLATHKIAALNVCDPLFREEHDAFGNSTQQRSSFLKVEEALDLTELKKKDEVETEILNRLSTGSNAEFRVALDMNFNSYSYFLENHSPERVAYPSTVPVGPRPSSEDGRDSQESQDAPDMVSVQID